MLLELNCIAYFLLLLWVRLYEFSPPINPHHDAREIRRFPPQRACQDGTCTLKMIQEELRPMCGTSTPNNIDISGVYHIGTNNILGPDRKYCWETIVKDQLETLSRCGLENMTKEFYVVVSPWEPKAKKMVLETFPNAKVIRSNLTESPWELDAMNIVKGICRGDRKYVYYLHGNYT